ncbi:cellulose biosynthesis protein BcsC [Azotobacter chroococcum]|uniref:Cellulose synthase operon protein C C-terminal domain protein n=1 Tax=Azotobacter chroococcum NCIMB 8003 TaxID=1328314 RepID=A0A0C4WQP2_9GAMM|nr:cellulose biosynthesis protein BcsC [Azotobacter chroococcum]AJE22984.1 Cellulose synthase operon protein C C-terminal domain protein [Azotobacter chroococcum NCIMB 8003]
MTAAALKKLSLAVLCALGGIALPEGALAEPADAGMTTLLKQADFWQSRHRPDLARETLTRALLVQPNAEEVLYRLGMLALPDDEKAAHAWLQRLTDSHPSSVRIGDLKAALKSSGLDKSGLARARLIASRGDAASAAQAYRQLFGGGSPPPDLALEYYQTLAGVDEHWQEARQGLEKLHAGQPDNLQVKLGLARALTYREATRRQAVEQLADLAPHLPEARAAWRQALLWLDASAKDQALYARYDEAHPGDAEVAARFQAALSAKRQNPGDSARSAGFNALRNMRNAAALQNFRQALNHNPRDAEAWGGMGIAQLRAQNYRDAHTSLLRAIELSPGERNKWTQALADAEFYEKLQNARQKRDDGRLDNAESLARQLTDGTGEHPRAAKLLLADILLRQQRTAEAEQLYRSLIDQSGDASPALVGLYDTLLRQGKRQAANDLLRQNPALSSSMQGGRQQVEALALRDRAEALRKQGDNQEAARLLNEALTLAPQNPWIRLSYARLLDANRDPQQAKRLMEPPEAGSADAEALHAAALLALDQERWSDAAAYLRRLPAERQAAPQIRILEQRLQIRARIAAVRSVAAGSDRLAARRALRALYDEAPSEPLVRGEVALALAELGEPALALGMVRDDLHNLSSHAAADYLAHVAVLVKTGQVAEADVLIHRLERSDMNADDREALHRLRNGFAVAQADRQRLNGDLAGAYDTLMPHIDESPHDAELLLAMGRLYNSGKMYKEATTIYDSVLKNAPDNPEGVRGAVNAALGSKDPKRAAQLIERAGPSLDEPTALLLSARVAEAKGDNRRAIALLESARRKHLAATGRMPDAPPGGGPVFMTRGNPFRDPRDEIAPVLAQSGGTYPGVGLEPEAQRATAPLADMPVQRSFTGRSQSTAVDPLANEIDSRLSALREKTATVLSAAAGLRVRDGEDGLSNLTEVKTPLQLSMVPLDNGRIELTATPTRLDAGTPGSDAAKRFGSYALASGLTESVFGAYNGLVKSYSSSALQLREQQAREAGQVLTLAERAGIVAEARNQAAQEISNAAVAAGLSAEQGERLASTLLNSTAQRVLAPYRPKSQDDTGVGLNLAYSSDSLKADIGTTPLGFEKTNLVGGAKWTQPLGQNGTLSLGAERRAVTDSLLSYAGTKDPVSGKTWGGVTKTGVNVQYAYDNGAAGLYAGGDYYAYRGDNVENNHSIGLHTGAYARPIRTDTRELQTGVHLNWMGFDKNLSGYTLGHGGYFSPENFVGVSFPVQYSLKANHWDMKLRAAAGYQSFTQERAPYFPKDKALQGQLEQLGATVQSLSDDLAAAGQSATLPTIETHYRADSQSGMAFNGGATLEYRLGERTRVGGTIGYDSFGDYSETTGSIYFKHALEDLP